LRDLCRFFKKSRGNLPPRENCRSISGFFVKMRQRNNIYKITGAADVKARILRPGILDNAYRL